MALASKNQLQFIDGMLSVPATTDPIWSIWNRCNTIVLFWITRAISPSIAESITWIDKAADAWNDIKDRFYQGDIICIFDLQEEIFAFK